MRCILRPVLNYQLETIIDIKCDLIDIMYIVSSFLQQFHITNVVLSTRLIFTSVIQSFSPIYLPSPACLQPALKPDYQTHMHVFESRERSFYKWEIHIRQILKMDLLKSVLSVAVIGIACILLKCLEVSGS